jgi:hypothetical protein
MARRYKLTNNTVVAGGQPANISMIPNAGSEYINAPVGAVDSTSAGLGVTVAPGTPDALGNPTFNVTAPSSIPAGTQITCGATDQTAAGTVTAAPLVLTVVSAPPPPLPEPTSISLVQNS